MADKPVVDRFIPPFEEPTDLGPTGPDTPHHILGDVIRAVGEKSRLLGGLAVRGGAGLASGTAALEPGAGTALGAIIGGGGEALAEKIEGQPINPGRIAVESAMGAIPMGWTFKAGNVGASMLRGALHGAAGVVGRKAADTVEGKMGMKVGDVDALKKWNLWDALPVALGAAGSGWAGSKATPTAAPPAINYTTMPPEGPQNFSDFDFKGQKSNWPVEKLKEETSKLEAQGFPQQAHGLRVAALKQNKGDVKVYDDITKFNAQAAKTSVVGGPLPTLDEALKLDPKKIEEVALRAEALGNQPFADTLRKQAVEAGTVSPTTSRVVTKAAKTEAKQTAAKQEIETAISLGLEERPTTVSRTASMETPSGRMSASTKYAPPPEKVSKDVGTLAGEGNPLATKIAKAIERDKEKYAIAQAVKASRQNKAPIAEVPTGNPAITEIPDIPVTLPSGAPTPEALVPSEMKAAGAAQADALKAEFAAKAAINPAAPITSSGDGPIAPQTPVEVSAANPSPVSDVQPPKQFAQFFRGPADAIKSAENSATNAAKMPPDVASHVDNLWAQMSTASKFGRKMLRRQIGEVGGFPTPKKTISVAKEPVQPPAIDTPPDVTSLPQLSPIEGEKLAMQFGNKYSNPEHLDPLTAALQENEMLKSLGAKPPQPQSNDGLTDATTGAVKPYPPSRKGESGAADIALLSHLAGAGIGAAGGAAMDRKDPWTGATLGAMAGLGTTAGIQAIAKNPDLAEKLKNLPSTAMKEWPNLQRFSMLFDPIGLPINTVAPVGSGIMGGLERMGTGAVERMTGQPVTEALDHGKALLKGIFSPELFKQIKPSWQAAKESLRGANERGEMLMGDTPNKFEQVLAGPGTIMGAGDHLVRTIGTNAGLPENLMRRITLTANPAEMPGKAYGLGKAIVNLPKQHPALGLMLPFSKTAINSFESGLERVPLLGFYFKASAEPNVAATMSEMIARQGLGGATAYAAYQLGEHVNPETAKSISLAKMVNNMAGQYGTIAAAAYAAGLASQMNKPRGPEAGKAILRDLPLPTTEPIQNYGTAAMNWLQGQPANPNANYPPERWLPKPLVPGIVRDKTIESMRSDLMPSAPKSRFIPPEEP